jgi:chorismate synthase
MRSIAMRSMPSRSARTRSSAPTAGPAGRWEKLVDEARKDGSSLGAVVECVATGVPAGWGAPIYGKLDADLASAMMGINAVKGVEIGEGFGAAALRGEQKRRSDETWGRR